MAKAKYILSKAAQGQIYAAKPLYERADGGKFDLDKPENLTQDDLEYLYENNLTPLVIKVEGSEIKKEQPKKPKN